MEGGNGGIFESSKFILKVPLMSYQRMSCVTVCNYYTPEETFVNTNKAYTVGKSITESSHMGASIFISWNQGRFKYVSTRLRKILAPVLEFFKVVLTLNGLPNLILLVFDTFLTFIVMF